MSDFRRSSGRQRRKNVQIVVTEGLSEQIYLERIRARFGDIPVHAVNASGGDIKKLKRECIKLIREKEAWDMLAVVTDVDEKTADEIVKFDEWCKENLVELYISNPSFEVFLLMHYTDVKAWMSQEDLEEALTSHLGRRYDKSRGITVYEDSVKDAMNRAERSLPKDSDDVETVSRTRGTTNFHRLLSKISQRLKR